MTREKRWIWGKKKSWIPVSVKVKLSGYVYRSVLWICLIWKIKTGFWSVELFWKDWRSCLKCSEVGFFLFTVSYRNSLRVPAWSVSLFLKLANYKSLFQLDPLPFALYLFIKAIKKVIFPSSTSCLIPTGSCFAVLLETQRCRSSPHRACFFTSVIMLLSLQLHADANITARRIKSWSSHC